MTREIRLLVLNCEFPPLGGGAATATRCLIEELAGFPAEVTLVTAAADGIARETRPRRGLRTLYVPLAKNEVHYWSSRELLEYAFAAHTAVKRLLRGGESFDVCHAFFTLPAGAVAMRHVAHFPYIVSLRGSDVPGYSGRWRTLYRLASPLFKRVWRRAAAVAANSEELRDLARETVNDIEIEVIPNGVETAVFCPPERRQSAGTILTVARLVERKDVGTIIRALSVLAGEFPDARLVIAGEGPQLETLRRLARDEGIADRVEFLRYVGRESMPEVYREADIFMLTSRREGMSNTILEALASGLPIVASPGALSGIEAPGALRVETGDAEGAARAAASLMRDRRALSAAAQASREAAMRYTWRAMTERYWNLYERVLAERGGGP